MYIPKKIKNYHTDGTSNWYCTMIIILEHLVSLPGLTELIPDFHESSIPVFTKDRIARSFSL